MSVELSQKGDSIKHEIISNGPYINSVFYKILQPTSVHILWKKYKGLNKDPTKSVWEWECEFDEIDLGNFEIDGNTIIDVKEKYNNISSVSKALVFDSTNEYDTLYVNKNRGGTSSDIYIITFNKDTSYVKYHDSWVDH
tara:strand:+ start:1238 stop:1654 length:417 start_codon:yes stop_codon:yes gene_type:complete